MCSRCVFSLNVCGNHVPSHLIKTICFAYKKTANLSFLTILGYVFISLFSFEALAANHDVPTSDKYDKDKALEFSQAAINRTIGSYKFINQDEKAIDIIQYRGKPLIVSLIYTSCHHICPTLTNHLAEVVGIAREALGEKSFSVITVGFDAAADSPERMRLFAHERNINLSGWDFLSTDEKTIKAFSDDLGFIFFKSAKGFDHLSQITLLDDEGKVYRQIYGINYEPPRLVEPLKELVFGNRSESTMVAGWINNVRLFCTIYDPHSGRYEFDYSIFIGIILGILILGAIALFIVHEWRKNNKSNGVT
jgi:protein SCO1